MPKDTLKAAIVNDLGVKRNIVNASIKVLFAQTFVNVKDVKTVNKNRKLLLLFHKTVESTS